MTLDNIISVAYFILTSLFDMVIDNIISVTFTSLASLLAWFKRVFLLKLFGRVWVRFVVVNCPRLIIRTARATALRYCLQTIPDSKNSARSIKRGEIVSAFSHYRNSIAQIRADKPNNSKDKITDVWITALIKAGELLGDGEAAMGSASEAGTPNFIEFSKRDLIPGQGLVGLTCWIHIHRDKTYWTNTSPYPSSFGENAGDAVNAVVEIHGLNEFIELLENVGLKRVELSAILESLQQAEFPDTPESFQT